MHLPKSGHSLEGSQPGTPSGMVTRVEFTVASVKSCDDIGFQALTLGSQPICGSVCIHLTPAL